MASMNQSPCKLKASRIVTNSPTFVHIRDSFPGLKQPTTVPYPQPDNSANTTTPYFFNIHYNIILPPIYKYSKQYLPFWFSD
jgi:hypothetical protein